jgi:hypothetical protein
LRVLWPQAAAPDVAFGKLEAFERDLVEIVDQGPALF